MDGKFNNNALIIDQDENEYSTESGPESPHSSCLLNEIKMTSSYSSSPKRSKRAVQKRVISVPIKDVEGSRLKGEGAPPPSDSWAWRKYGQKPIKGSPYPRGYYRCSSSKGCPARKQVERSRVDPSMLVVTYSCEHNHPWPPPSKNHHHHHNGKGNNPTLNKPETSTPTKEPEENPEQHEPEEKFTDLGDESLISTDEFSWFGEMQTTSSTILENPIFTDNSRTAKEVEAAIFYPIKEEDESLFADLGELPECSSVFRHHRGWAHRFRSADAVLLHCCDRAGL